jgi:imidazolonepropionase-like amidohydrolase
MSSTPCLSQATAAQGGSRIAFLLALAPLLLVPASADTVLFHARVLHSVHQAPITNASFVVRDGRFLSIQPAHRPDGIDREVDLGNLEVFPGLIATTTILGLVEIEGVRATRDTTEVGEFTPDVHAWVAVNPDSELIPVARANGITHAQVVPLGGVVSGHSAVIALSGWTIEDLAVQRSAALHVFWPSFGLDTTPRSAARNPNAWKSLEDQTRERDNRIRSIDAFFTEAQAYRRWKDAHPDAPVASPVPAWEAMLPFLRGQYPLFLHADELRQIRSAVEWTARRQFKAVLAGGRDAWHLADLLAKHQIPVAYEHVFTLPPRDTDPFDVQFHAPKILAQAGVQVAFAGGTSRFGGSNLRNLPYDAAQAVAYGLSADQALRGLTLYPAEILGLAQRLGSIEPGKDATFFAATGHILDIRSQVKRMWIQGNETSLDSRHTRLYDRYRARPLP